MHHCGAPKKKAKAKNKNKSKNKKNQGLFSGGKKPKKKEGTNDL